MSVKKDLQDQIQKIEGSELKEHMERQSLVLLKPGVSLIEVGMAFAQDSKQAVEAWLQNKDIWKATNNDIPELTSSHTYEFLILQPFVIAQKYDPTLH